MKYIVKRNNTLAEYLPSNIIIAIKKAMSETIDGIDESVAKEIANKITEIIDKANNPLNVEEIQDLVENYLMESDRKDVAKRYIIYRYERGKSRTNNRTEGHLLSDKFISKYKHMESPMDQLGNFVYYRTYSRWLPNEGRREYWWETVRRAVEYNCRLAKCTSKEAEELYDNIFNLRQFLSGRTFWVGGTKVAYDYPTGNYNCAFNIMNKFEAFRDLFYLLMVGSGVGLRILKSDVDQLPKIRTNVNTYHDEYEPTPKSQRIDSTTLQFISNDSVKIIVGDSKSGWVQALDFYLKILWDTDYKSIKNILINYNFVRPKGEPLKTFGGTASGYQSLKNMFTKINKLLQKYSKESNKIKLKPIDCLDISNIIGENVVVGGVRRTSEIMLVDDSDEEVIKAKENLYENVNGEWIPNKDILHRTMSNNSIYYRSKPTRERLHWLIEKMRYSGEPGWINEEAGLKRRKNMNGVNPCFVGSMRLLTNNGYETFEELSKIGMANIVVPLHKHDYCTLVRDCKIWCSGEKEIWEIKLENGDSLLSTGNHIYRTIYNNTFGETEAKDLKGCYLEKNYVNLNDYKNDPGLIKVIDVINTGRIEKVYDFNVPGIHWGIVEGYTAHNCGEILLDNKGMCNLTTLNVLSFVEDGVLNIEEILKAQRLSARAGFRMTQVELELPEWDKVQKRDHLTGCSLTGWQDMINATNMNKEDEIKLLQQLKQATRETINKYCDELGIKDYPDAVTTVKPEGTLSQLPGVSSGIHYSHSPYFIRRVRINATDPLVKVCEELNYPIFAEVGQDIETCSTKVIEFPCKAPGGRTKYDVSAIEQLENYKMFMKYYVEHNVSITVHVRNHEWEEIEEWVWNNWDDTVALTFLSLDDSFYQLMPYEAITKEEYEKRVKEMKPFIPSLLQKYEKQEVEYDIGISDCSGGICPIK